MILSGTLDTKSSIELVAVAIAKSFTTRNAKQKSDRGNGGSFTRPNPSTRECRNIEVTRVCGKCKKEKRVGTGFRERGETGEERIGCRSSRLK